MKQEAEFNHRDYFLDVGICIGAVRKKRGLTQEQLAERACISRGTISKIEAPHLVYPPSLETLCRISDVLEVRPGDLLNKADALSEE